MKVDLFGKENGSLKGIGDTPNRMKNGDIKSLFRHEDGRILEFGKNDFLQGKTTGYIGSLLNKENARKQAEIHGVKNGKESYQKLVERFGEDRPYLLKTKTNNKYGYKGLELSKNFTWISKLTFDGKTHQKKFDDFFDAVIFRNSLEIKYFNPLLKKHGLEEIKKIEKQDIKTNDLVLEAIEKQKEYKEKVRLIQVEKSVLSYYEKGELNGVHYDKKRKKWKATMYFNGKLVLNKRFNTKQEAIEARLAAEEKYFKPILEKYENKKEND